jgi:DnaJ-class molecular chaperone
MPIAGLVLWLAALANIAVTKTLARMLDEQHAVRQELEAERDRQASQLVQRETQIIGLEEDLERARVVCGSPRETEVDRAYRRVGLHSQAPEFLVTAARRAFRAALHPDRHPRHQQAAHDRFLQAEAAFERIAELRR